MGIITAVFGGRPGMISGATGAIAVVLVDVVLEGNEKFGGLGIELLFAAVVLAGVIQVAVGALQLGRFIRLVPHLPAIPMSWDVLIFITPYAFIVAAVGIIESLMTVQLIDEITETRGQGNRECIAQGAANILCGFFKGMGGCAMIGQSLINIKSGGRGRTSGIVAALALLFFIVAGYGFIDQIPIAALVGVMFMVVIGTFEWTTFRTVGKVPVSDLLVIGIVTGWTVWHDLAQAVIVGVIVSALVYAWKSAKHVNLIPEDIDEENRTYHMIGMLYFGSVREFAERLAPSRQKQQNIIVDFKDGRVCDYSSIEAINTLAERYKKIGKSLHLRHLSPECRKMIHDAKELVEVNIIEDPQYTIARL